ncbi:MAG TPA: type 4a pilus biogenesis protein PilO [Gaiellaceae bacterium]|jgi:type IV pilus assembly protein PilO|nr:type 4a pilus biogenesis protein PilO [Gaiellaceae bacterium]
MKRPKNMKLFIGVAGVALVALVGYFLVVSPQRSKAADLKRQIASSQAQLALLQAAAHAGPQSQRVRVAEVSRLATAMPTSPDVPDLLLELDGVSRATGIQFKSITPGTPTPGIGFTVVPISLIFQGSYYNLNDFLFRLRNLVRVSDGKLAAEGRLYSVSAVTFGQGDKKFPQVQATLTVNAYDYAPATIPTPTAATGTPTSSTSTTSTTTTTTPTTTQPSPPTGASAAAATTGASN